MYAAEQVKEGIVGPINIHGVPATLLFMRGCADHVVGKKLSSERLLQCHQKQIDFCFYLATLCSFVSLAAAAA